MLYLWNRRILRRWKEALRVLNLAEYTRDAILWWSDIEVVGSKENNIAMILFHLSDRFEVEDDIELEKCIGKAAANGFSVPTDLICNIK